MEGKQRFLFIDGLRGVAAVAVLLHHAACRTVCGPVLAGHLPAVAWGVLLHLNAGVEIFFVISGFVIAHSLRESIYSPPEVGRFIVRRQLRLDPPYWVVLAGALLCGWIGSRAGVMVKGAGPSGVGGVVANLFYLQGLLGRPAVLDVAWTLCIEVQFYLAFILLMAAGRLRGPGTCGRPSRSARAMLLTTALASLLANPATDRGVTLAPYWCYFAGGVLCYWAYRRQVGAWQLAVLAAGFAASAVVRLRVGGHAHLGIAPQDAPVPVCVGLVTIAALHVVGRAGGLTTVLSNRPFQYFGAVSYSLYLVHVTVLGIVTRGGVKLLHADDVRVLVLVPVGVLLSVGVAHLLHVLVERPSMRFAHSFNRRGRAIEPSNGVQTATVAASL